MTLLLTLDDGSIHRKLAGAVDTARAAVLEEAAADQVGEYVGVQREDAVSVSHQFEAAVPGYGGWRWCVTVALAAEDDPVTVSEVVLIPGPDALVAPAWVPWERRVQAGDLGVGDLFPTDDDDPRLAPAYLASDDPAVEEVALEAGLGRVHVLSRFGREDAADRWRGGDFGPRSDMARSAPGHCGTCGFFVPLGGSLRAAFGACTNDIAPADGHVVDVEYGCGAHSEVEVEVTSSIPVAELVYDDSVLEFESHTPVDESHTEDASAEAVTVEVKPTAVLPDAAEATETASETAEADVEAAAVLPDVPEAAQTAVVEDADEKSVEADAVSDEAAPAVDVASEVEPAAVLPDVTEAAQTAVVAEADAEPAEAEADAEPADETVVAAESTSDHDNG